MTDIWNAKAEPATGWLAQEITPELEEKMKQAYLDWKNDPVKQAALKARLAPYQTKIHWTTWLKMLP